MKGNQDFVCGVCGRRESEHRENDGHAFKFDPVMTLVALAKLMPGSCVDRQIRQRFPEQFA